MKYTSNYNLKKPEGTDIVNIDDLNDNADILDQKLKEVEDKANNAPPNSVNDAAIGSRTPDQSQAPASPGTGTLTQLVSWLANRIKTITGKTNWWDEPPTTLQAAKAHMDAAAPHSGHETPSGAQTKANAAEANAKSYTDTHAGTKNTHGVGSGYYIAKTSRSDQLPAWNDLQGKPSNFTPSAHKSTHASGGSDALTPSDIGAETPTGAQAKANAALNSANQYTDQEVAKVNQALNTHIDATFGIHGAVSSAMANRLIIRDSAGQASVATPTNSSHIATKGYVDNTVSSHANTTSGVHGATSSATANRIIIRDSAGQASVATPTNSSHIATKGYVDSAVESALESVTDPTSPIATKDYVDSAVNNHANATSVHGATSSATANRIIIRDSAGRAKVAAPSASDDIARKAEVDTVSSALDAHKSSGDHDGRYYTKSQLEPFIRDLLLNYWTSLDSGTTFILWDVVYADGYWVAVGYNGAILTSTNGTSWTSRTSGTSEHLRGVAYGNGLWVVTGYNGRILTSTNGTSWTSRTSGTSRVLASVAYGNGLWVAVGSNGTILTSTNGTSWTSRTSGTSEHLNDVAYGNGLWVAVGYSGTILTSTDGTSWTSRDSGTSQVLDGVAYANGLWVVVGDDGTILTSANGSSWASRPSGTSYILARVAYADGYWVAVGNGGTILTSTNGFMWVLRSTGMSFSLTGVAYADNLWVTVGSNGVILTARTEL